jgi:Zn finger protein HypA/HybF involved in hydrogenase expression
MGNHQTVEQKSVIKIGTEQTSAAAERGTNNLKTKTCGLCHQTYSIRYFDISAVCPSCHKSLIQLDQRYYCAIGKMSGDGIRFR